MRDDNTTNCDEHTDNEFMTRYQAQNEIEHDNLMRTSSRGRFLSADQAEGEQIFTAKPLIDSKSRATDYHEISDASKAGAAYKFLAQRKNQEEYSFCLDDQLSDARNRLQA